ncbi:MAG TPA: insulinase family protein [Bacilli bacterium]|jgi:Zn-dependent M16 (insulinase) family peptidase|nr:insulinase family protein [Bacilli bacterium]HOR17790.1 insulinase family protein [Bacilli bacterium]
MKNLTQYQVLQEKFVKELDSQATFFKHKKSGARVLVFKNNDNNKVFAMGFKTPPANSTGLPHILEHSVLCGTRKYPVKEVFVELMKGSLNTFLNAMTFPDKTIYPVASCNDKDFANLMDVYMDAVLYPRIGERPEIFLQEGWHYELNSKEEEITYNGVVYNEMKGAFSSPERILSSQILHTMFPDNCYGKESGGDPEEIINLSYEEFLSFHKTYYHPSNSYIILYGDLDVEEKLAWLDNEYLKNFDKINIDAQIKPQKPFTKPLVKEIAYPIGQGEDANNKTYLSYTVTAGKGLDTKTWMAFNILSYILLDMPGAPLKQALLDAKIGQDISSNFYDGIEEQMISIIAKNADIKDNERFVQVIEQTISDLITKGLDKKAIQAAINKYEFRYREADFGGTPKGIVYVINTLDSWLYDENDPFSHLETEKIFAEFKEEWNTDYFEKLLEKYFLKNHHKLILKAVPDKEIGARKEAKIKQRLADFKNSLSNDELEKIIEDTKNLKKYQSTPSTPEELATIPVLTREDINKEPAPLVNEEKEVASIKVMHQNIFTNGIGYLKIMFDIKGLPNNMLGYLGLLPSILGYVDTKNYTYQELNKEIDINTGDISFNTLKLKTKNDYLIYFGAFSKVLYHKVDFALSMISEIINNSLLTSEKRLLEIITKRKAELERRASFGGHRIAVTRSMSYYSPMNYIEDYLNGVNAYQFIRDLEMNFETKKQEIVQELTKLIKHIFRKDNMLISYTANEEGYSQFVPHVETFKDSLKGESVFANDFKYQPKLLNEGLKTSSNVQYVARSGNFLEKGYSYHGSLAVLNNILAIDYLWNNVRVKGGAYGCMIDFDRFGDSFFVSYRDPNLRKTNEVYEGIIQFIEEFKASDEEMTKAIIGVIGSIDAPRTPAGTGGVSLFLALSGITMEAIRQEREEIINCKEQDIKDLKKVVQAVLDYKALCVVGNENKIEEEKDLFKNISYLLK